MNVFKVLKSGAWEVVPELEWNHSLQRRARSWGVAGVIEYHGPTLAPGSELFSIAERECKCSACSMLVGGPRKGFEHVFEGQVEE